MKTKTQNYGANTLKWQAIRKLERFEKLLFKTNAPESVLDQFETLIKWVKNFDERAAKRKGGLGKL